MAGYKKNMAQYENLTGWEKLSLGKQLDKWAVQYGDRIAVADSEKEITYFYCRRQWNRHSNAIIGKRNTCYPRTANTFRRI